MASRNDVVYTSHVGAASTSDQGAPSDRLVEFFMELLVQWLDVGNPMVLSGAFVLRSSPSRRQYYLHPRIQELS